MSLNMTLGQFIAHLSLVPAVIAKQVHASMTVAAKLVEAEARLEVGRYQGAASPFVAWAELADATKDDRVRQGFPENEPGLRTGAMRDSIGHVVGRNEFVVGSDDQNLVWFELGTSKQPPRSVLGMALVHKAPEVANLIGHGFTAGLVGPGVAGGSFNIK